MLVFAGVTVDLFDLGLRNFMGEDSTDTLAAGVDLKHDAGGSLAVESEKTFQHVNDKFHRRVVVINQYYLV